jgi:tol-pal system protein YbgF
MKHILSICAVSLSICLFVALVAPAPVGAVSKEIVQLQQMVQLLSDQVRDLQKVVLEKNALMTQLVEKSADNTNKLQTTIEALQRTLQSSLGSQVTSTNQRLDGQQQRLQLINDSVDELKARQNKLSEQLTQIRQLLETVQAPAQCPAPSAAQPVAPPVPAAPPAPVLYESALKDLYASNTKQAIAEFQDYLKFYPDGERAENCQYYIGEIRYTDGDYQRAVDAYNEVIDRFPKGNKTAAAHLKKGYALLELRQKDAAVKELRALIQRFPASDEAKRAKDRLASLGAANATPAKSKPRRN